MAFKLTGSGVDISSGRGKARVTISVDFKQLEDWAKRMKIDTPRLMDRSFGRAASGLKKQFQAVMREGGGVNGVPKFKTWEAFTVELRSKERARAMGGTLSDPRRIVAFKRGRWQVIGWPDDLAEWADNFQDGTGKLHGIDVGQNDLNNPSWRRRVHQLGIKYIPREYVHNPRRVIPEPFGAHVRANLREWARGAYYKELARQMQKAGAL